MKIKNENFSILIKTNSEILQDTIQIIDVPSTSGLCAPFLFVLLE